MWAELAGVLVPILGLGLIALASREIGGQFRRARLPLISGFLVCGAVAGPHVLGLLSSDTVERLVFVDQVAIAFIAFAAGSELYLKEFRDRLRSILWVTAGIAVATFTLGTVAFLWMSAGVPSIAGEGTRVALAASFLVGAILVAISPSSAIAVIKELRASGPFTRTVLGVTVIVDAVVIVLFTMGVEVADALVTGLNVRLGTFVLLAVELLMSIAFGVLVGLLLRIVLGFGPGIRGFRSVALLSIGYGVFVLADRVHDVGPALVGYDVRLEPMLACMVAGLFVANATPFRNPLRAAIERDAPVVFVVFFTLTGASLALDVLALTWRITLGLFVARLAGMMLGAFTGGLAAGEPARRSGMVWMGLITQAGVSLGLARDVAYDFPGWGSDVATIVIAVIVVNQLTGPPLFRWVLKQVGEAHPAAEKAGFDGVRDAIIFGHEGQAVALARQLHAHGWQVKLAAREGAHLDEAEERGLEIVRVDEINKETFERLEASRADCVAALLDDETNFEICEIVYEEYGTANLVVRAHASDGHDRYRELGAVVVDPRTAMISLLDHLVRSPHSTALLLGMEEGRDVAEIQVGNPNLHGVELRELRLPQEALVLSLRRGSHTLITNGSTRLKLYDWVTVFGSLESLDEVAVRFEGEMLRDPAAIARRVEAFLASETT